MHEAASSILASSTSDNLTAERGFRFGGVVAGEGCFCVTRQRPRFVADGSERKRFVFLVTMATRDRPLLEQLHAFLGVGSLRDSPPGRQGWQPTTTFTVNSIRAHRAAVIPFSERYLLETAKWRQFEGWRDTMQRYWDSLPAKHRWGSGRSICGTRLRRLRPRPWTVPMPLLP